MTNRVPTDRGKRHDISPFDNNSSAAQCRVYYQNAHQDYKQWVKDYYRMDRVGYQIFVIPKTGIYKFSVYGAGHGGSYRS